jgi:hypothetical protein
MLIDRMLIEMLYCTHHPLRQKLDMGPRNTILSILVTTNPRIWISVDYLRISYDKKVAQNNSVVLITSRKVKYH